jgi:hypothetical protein
VGQLLVGIQDNLLGITQNNSLVSDFLNLCHSLRHFLAICSSTKVIIDGPSEEFVQNRVSIRVEQGRLGIGDNVQNRQGGFEK